MIAATQPARPPRRRRPLWRTALFAAIALALLAVAVETMSFAAYAVRFGALFSFRDVRAEQLARAAGQTAATDAAALADGSHLRPPLPRLRAGPVEPGPQLVLGPKT